MVSQLPDSPRTQVLVGIFACASLTVLAGQRDIDERDETLSLGRRVCFARTNLQVVLG